MSEEFLTEPMLAELIGVSCITIRTWRATEKGPRYVRVGRLIRYRRVDIDEWIERQTLGEVQPKRKAKK